MLLVLGVMWGGLIVWWLRSHAQGGSFTDTVGTFSRHLTVIERTAPVTVRPANRLRGPQMVPAYRPPVGGSSVAGVGRRPVPSRPSLAPADLRRRQTLKRRRDILFVLVVALVATLVMAIATRSRALVLLQVVVDLALACYIGLLVRLRNLAAEREHKLTYLPRVRAAGHRYEVAGYGGDTHLAVALGGGAFADGAFADGAFGDAGLGDVAVGGPVAVARRRPAAAADVRRATRRQPAAPPRPAPGYCAARQGDHGHDGHGYPALRRAT